MSGQLSWCFVQESGPHFYIHVVISGPGFCGEGMNTVVCWKLSNG